MKKLAVISTALAVVVFGGFFWLLSQSGPNNAPTNVTVIDLEDNYEK